MFSRSFYLSSLIAAAAALALGFLPDSVEVLKGDVNCLEVVGEDAQGAE